MEGSVIHSSLDLLLRLIDTTTGAAVEEKNVRFFRDERQVFPIPKGSGNYVFLNSGKEDHILTVEAFGYDVLRMSVRYEDLDRQIPAAEAFLIPSESAGGAHVLTFSGRLSGIEAIEAVNLGLTCSWISGYDEQERLVKLLRTRSSGMDAVWYGLIHLKEQTYEPFQADLEVSADSVKIRQPLKEPFCVNSPIARIIFGRAASDGSYILRVRDDGKHPVYLVRYVVGSRVKFKVIDFFSLEDAALD